MNDSKKLNTGNVDLAKINVDEELLDILFDIAMLGISRSYFDQAKFILLSSLALQPERGRLLIGLGLFSIATKNYEDAVELFQDLLKEDPKNPYAKVHLGLTYWHMKKFDEAKKALNEVVSEKSEPSMVSLAEAILGEIKVAA